MSDGAGGLLALVGPSGSGKDTVLDGLRSAFAGEPRVVFARRTVTRPAHAGGEDHDPMTEAAFEKAEAAGAFAVTWRANGLAYGLPAHLADSVADGDVVIANGSRQALPAIREAFGRVTVVALEVEAEELRRRLESRGRESDGEIEARLRRALETRISGDDVVRVDNSRAPEYAVAELSRIVRGML